MKKFLPEKSDVWRQDYISYRRLWLDSCLESFADEMRGVVVDLGGKRENKRGWFQPPEDKAQAWWYINLDRNTSPNIFADVMQAPLHSQSVDCVLCTEVLEHIPDPKACVNEMNRLLRKGGIAFVSAPFMYPVHADPFDFQRFTDEGLRILFKDFTSVDIIQMGSYAGTLGMLIEVGLEGIQRTSLLPRIIRWSLGWVARWLCWFDLSHYDLENVVWNKFTTGYFVKAVR